MQMAAMEGCEESITAILKWGADCHIQDPRGLTPLNALATRDYPQAARVLLDADADINTVDKHMKSALHRAVQREKINVVKVLLDYGIDIDAVDDIGISSIHLACGIGNITIFRLLQDRGADLTKVDTAGKCLLHFTARGNLVNVLQEMIESGIFQHAVVADLLGQTPLYHAVRYGSTAVMSYLLSLQKNVLEPSEAMTLLHVAATHGQAESIQCLMAHNLVPDINIVDPQTGNNALHLAVIGPLPQQTARTVELANQLTETVAYLISVSGANALAVDSKGRTAVHLASNFGHEAIFITLMDHIRLLLGQSVNIRDRSANQYTALHYAAATGRVAIVEALLKDYHADIHAKCAGAGYTPLHMAADSGQESVVHLLLTNGADIDGKSTKVRSIFSLLR